jgi:hypothetical protein
MDLRNRGFERPSHSRPGDTTGLWDRRRPGRINDINPALYDLLRGTAADRLTSNDFIRKNIPNNFCGDHLEEDNLREARGILNAVVISVLLWALFFGILLTIYLVV